MTDEPRLPAAPVRAILKRTGMRVTPDCVATAQRLAEEAIERAARRAAQDVRSSGRGTIDGDHFATWWMA